MVARSHLSQTSGSLLEGSWCYLYDSNCMQSVNNVSLLGVSVMLLPVLRASPVADILVGLREKLKDVYFVL